MATAPSNPPFDVTGSAATDAKVYESARGRQALIGVVLLLVSLACLWPSLHIWQHFFAGGPVPDDPDYVAVFGLFGFPPALLALSNALRGRPRLTVTADGILLQNGFWTRWARWDSLGPFEVMTIHGSRRVQVATAKVIGPHASRGSLRRQSFAMPATFLTPIAEIVADLNAVRARVAGPIGLPPQPAEPVAHFGLAGFTTPWLTYGLLALLGVIFLGEQVFAVTPGSGLSPSVATLAAMGGLSRNAVAAGEWYRLFTAPLLHAGLMHILGNGLALWLGGRLFERLVGRLWFLAILILGALGGSLMSITVNPPTMISVGASGSLMGMFAAIMVSSLHMPKGLPIRQGLQRLSLQVLIPSMLPFLAPSASGNVDYGAHLGGGLTGAAVSFLLLQIWRDGEPIPAFRTLALAISAVGALAFAASAVLAVGAYGKYDVALIPATEWPKLNAGGPVNAADLVARYPGDPRAHLYLGSSLLAVGDNAGAEREFRTALGGAQNLSLLFGRQLEFGARGVLASLLASEDRRDEAKVIARPVCAAAAEDPGLGKFAQILINQQLCE